MTVEEALTVLDAHPIQVAMIEIQHPDIGRALKTLAKNARKEIKEVANGHSCSGRAGWEGQT